MATDPPDCRHARPPLLGYRGRILLLAAVIAGLPYGLLVAGVRPSAAVLAGAGAIIAIAIVWLANMLRPIAIVARELAAAGATGGSGPPARASDEPRRMLADIAGIAARLEGLRYRWAQRHPVTDLPTREHLLAEMAADMDASTRTLLGTIRFAEFDRLAAFDQTAADSALAAFAKRLGTAVARGRPFAQVDRDAFAIWFRGIDDVETAAAELQALVYVCGQELSDGERDVAPQVEAGTAVHPTDGTDPAALLTRALLVMTRPATSAPGKVILSTTELALAARQRFVLEQDLAHAIAREQLELHFQPVVDLAAGRPIGAEALLRWRHHELGMVSPASFMPVVEEAGLAEEFGMWILNAACREARRWRDDGLPGLKMAVNLSARQLHDPALKVHITRTLERHALPPAALELELTETAAMEDSGRTRTLFGELRALGVSLAIDDFGSGYSSLSYVKNLPFDKLKIDREFVTKVEERRDSRAICRALIELARGLDITLLAEGTETRAEVETLRNLGCTIFQGYYFSPPLPAADFTRKVRSPEWLALLSSPVHREIAGLRSRLSA